MLQEPSYDIQTAMWCKDRVISLDKRASECRKIRDVKLLGTILKSLVSLNGYIAAVYQEATKSVGPLEREEYTIFFRAYTCFKNLAKTELKSLFE